MNLPLRTAIDVISLAGFSDEGNYLYCLFMISIRKSVAFRKARAETAESDLPPIEARAAMRIVSAIFVYVLYVSYRICYMIWMVDHGIYWNPNTQNTVPRDCD